MLKHKTLLAVFAVLVLTTGISGLTTCISRGPSITDVPPSLAIVSTPTYTATPALHPTYTLVRPTMTPSREPASIATALDPSLIKKLHDMDMAMASTNPVTGTLNVRGKSVKVLRYDLNGDGLVEVMAVDLDQDGRFGLRLYDLDGDKLADYAKYDTNRNGQFETLTLYQYKSGQWIPLYPNALPLPLPFPYLYLP